MYNIKRSEKRLEEEVNTMSTEQNTDAGFNQCEAVCTEHSGGGLLKCKYARNTVEEDC